MELRVEAAPGYSLPTGCFIGVRVGEVLKQGRYDPLCCYRFPALERERNAKIDLYQHLGTCSAMVGPALRKSNVIVSASEPGIGELRLKVVTGPQSAKPREERKTEVKTQAKTFLEQHLVEQRLCNAVKALLEAQPTDPTEFLVAHLRESCPSVAAGKAAAKEAAAKEAAAKEVAAAEAAAKEDAAKEVAAAKKAAAAKEAAAREAAAKETAARDAAAKEALNQARDAAAQPEKTEQAPFPPVDILLVTKESVHLKAYQDLINASCNGNLNAALQLANQPQDEAVDANTKPVVTKDSVRQKAKQDLINGARNGNLNGAMRPADQPQDEAVDANAKPAVTKESLRLKAKQDLINAARNGNLNGAMRPADQPQDEPVDANTMPAVTKESVRLKAKQDLINASRHGNLNGAMRPADHPQGVEAAPA